MVIIKEIQVCATKNMISSVLIGGFVRWTEHYCICPVSVKRTRSDFREKSVFDDSHLNKTQKIATELFCGTPCIFIIHLPLFVS